MLAQPFSIKQFANDTHEILNKWDPRISNKSQLQRDSTGNLTASSGALQRIPATQSGGKFYDLEKSLFIQNLDDFLKLINSRCTAISQRSTTSIADYFNQSNAIQGLINITLAYKNMYDEKARHIRKAESVASKKKSYQHLTSDAVQNNQITYLLNNLDVLVRTLRHAQKSILTSRGENADLLEDVLDQSVFKLGENIFAYVPYHEQTLRRFLNSPCVNPLINGLRLKLLISQNLRHVTICPSWPSSNLDFPLMGPNLYFRRFFNASHQGTIPYENLTLSVLMNFYQTDDVSTILPAVQVMLEIAQLHQYGRVVFHAPNGFAAMLYALGFRSNDKDMLMPDLFTQANTVKTLFNAGKSIKYDVTQPFSHFDSLDEKFMHETDLRCFYFDMANLDSKQLYLPLMSELQSWTKLLRNKRYLSQDCAPNMIPAFNSLPYSRYTPSFNAIREREITGRMPVAKTSYVETPFNVADVATEQVLQSIGAMAISFKATEQIEHTKSGTVVKLK